MARWPLPDIVDIKPNNMEELTEVITAAEFHPTHCSQFIYSSSKGTIKLCDMRANALCDQHAKGTLSPEAERWTWLRVLTRLRRDTTLAIWCGRQSTRNQRTLRPSRSSPRSSRPSRMCGLATTGGTSSRATT